MLLVDAAQGIEAQTLANLYLALENDLTIIPVLNKIDLPAAQPEKYAEELAQLIGCEPEDCLRVSGKTGEGVEPLLDQIVAADPGPAGRRRRAGPRDDLRLGLRHLPRRRHLRPRHRRQPQPAREDQDDVDPRDPRAARDRRHLPRAGARQGPRRRRGRLPHHRREGRAPVQGRRHRHQRQQAGATEALGGYRDPKPMVFSGLYPIDGSDYPDLRDALDKLKLNDAALVYEPETSVALGFGFRVRLPRPAAPRDRPRAARARVRPRPDLDPAERRLRGRRWTTAPSITVTNPSEFPDGKIAEVYEPMVRATILAPERVHRHDHGAVPAARGELRGMDYLSAERVELRYTLPLAEIIFDFFDQLKSRTRGYASLDYEPDGDQEADLVKVDILLQGETVDAFSAIVHKDKAYAYGVMMAAKLKELIPRQQFEVPIQAAIGARIIARENIRAIRKDVLAKCYGGDITRKRKLLEKQKEGKKRMKTIGPVEVPQEAFIAALSTDGAGDKATKK